MTKFDHYSREANKTTNIVTLKSLLTMWQHDPPEGNDWNHPADARRVSRGHNHLLETIVIPLSPRTTTP